MRSLSTSIYEAKLNLCHTNCKAKFEENTIKEHMPFPSPSALPNYKAFWLSRYIAFVK
jgi:hypothetical protein